MSNVKYSIKKKMKDPLETVFTKKNIELDFTMQQMLDYENSADKMLTELIGQADIEDAKQKNVEENHPDAIDLVRNLDPVKQNAIRIWLDAKDKIAEICPKRDELRAAIDEHKEEIKVIKAATGWEPFNEKEDGKDKGKETKKRPPIKIVGGNGEESVS